MGLGDSFENRKTNRLKDIMPAKIEYQSTFDYSEINDEDKDDLLTLESLVINKKQEIINQVIELGDILYQANLKLANYKTGKFMEWYSSLGLNKDEVSVALKRYSIFLEYPDKKDIIAELPVRTIKVITKESLKETPEFLKEVTEKTLNQEFKTSGELNKFISSHNTTQSSDEEVKVIPEKKIGVNRIKNKKADIVNILKNRFNIDESQQWETAEEIINLILGDLNQ